MISATRLGDLLPAADLGERAVGAAVEVEREGLLPCVEGGGVHEAIFYLS